ncbi:MAG: Do family serine endopeptidase, partial [Rudaea sp.]
MRVWRFISAVCLLGLVGQAAAQPRELPDFTRLVEEQGPAVVNISTKQAVKRGALPQIPGIGDEELQEFFRRFMPKQPIPEPRSQSRSLGSGFIISPDGYILTNAHVIEGADEIDVRFTDKREMQAKVIGADRRTDVALIKVEARGLPVVKFGDPSRLKVGEWVVAIGSPFGFDNTVTAGIVSAKGRSLPDESLVPFIQTDVAINPGNSGGPLFNMRGEVVGINSQIYSRTGGFMGLSFAIPIDVALDVQGQLREHGRVSRGRIGVVIQEVTRDLATSFGLDRPRGALVNTVEEGSPAARAGIQPSDIILSFGGKAVESSIDL